MPKDSLNIKGFNGGLNKESSLSDLEFKSGDAELSQLDAMYTDKSGKVHAAFNEVNAGYSTGSGLSSQPEGLTDDAEEILAHDGKVYQKKGVCKIGDKVNWSGNTGFQVTTPTSGAINNSFVQSDDVNIKFKQVLTNPIILFATTTSSLNPGSDTLVFGESSIDYPRDFIGQVTANYGETNWGNNYWNPSEKTIGDEFLTNNSLSNPYIGAVHNMGVSNALNDTGEDSSVANILYLFWNKYSVQGGDSPNYSTSETSALLFRGGKKDLYNPDSTAATETSASSRPGKYGNYFPSLENKDIMVEIAIIDSEAREDIDGVFVWFDTEPEDSDVKYGDYDDATPYDPNIKVWWIDRDTLISSGCFNTSANPGFVQLRSSAATFTGASYAGDEFVTVVGIAPLFKGSIHYTSGPQLMVLHGLVLADSMASSWSGMDIQISQSIVKNGVESLLYNYPASQLNLANLAHELEVCRPHNNMANGGDSDQGKLYWQRLDGNGMPMGDHFGLAEWDYTEGLRLFSSDTFTAWTGTGQLTAAITMNNAPVSTTFSLESGYPDRTTEINATWETAASIGRQVYIGNVTQPIGGTNDASLILKSSIGKAGGFSNKTFIDIEVGGDTITVLESAGDRLFVFTKNSLHIINVAQDIEFLEAEFPNYGVLKRKQVCKIGEGLAFINNNGVYYFNGKSFNELTQNKIPIAEISDANLKALLYDEKRKLLWCWIDMMKVYYFSFNSNTWVGYDSSVYGYIPGNSQYDSTHHAPLTNSVTGNDGRLHYAVLGDYQLNNSGIFNIGDIDNSSDRDMSMTTGKIDFGDISRKKKIYSVYVTATNASEDLKFKYSFDGGSNWSTPVSFASGTGENKFEIDDSIIGNTGKHITINIAGEGVVSGVVIDDISIIYRNKSLK